MTATTVGNTCKQLKQGNYWRKPTGKEKWKGIAETGVLAFQERSQLSPRRLSQEHPDSRDSSQTIPLPFQYLSWKMRLILPLD
jgi:hypothetical protein